MLVAQGLVVGIKDAITKEVIEVLMIVSSLAEVCSSLAGAMPVRGNRAEVAIEDALALGLDA